MDLLSSLNLHVLPEQQTRINDKISKSLQENPNIRLGFDACCNCAKPLKNSDKEDVCCKGCRRVWYCSKECRREDTKSSHNHMSGEEEQAGGHSAVVCSMLRLCNIDEEVENDLCKNNKRQEGKSKSKDKDRESTKNKKGLSSSKSSSTLGRKIKFSDEERRASMDRISSEYESYPATLNVLMDAPCFESTLDKFMLKRRGKKTRQHHLEENEQINDNNTLTIHIIGASAEAELWGDFQMDQTDAMSAYSDALSELSSTYRGLRKIVLAFIGPNCPKDKKRVVKCIDGADIEGHEETSSTQKNGKKRKRDGGKHCQVVIETFCHNYETKYFKSKDTSSSSSIKKKGKHHHHHSLLSKPNVVVFFNPGFTCPDYQWHEALKACRDFNRDTSTQTPFIVTTNTEMEAIADIQYLHQHGYIDSLPSTVADIVNEGQLDHDSDTFDQKENNAIFFGENINAGNRVRQSGNMANDLFCKNKYIFGGHFAHCENNRSKKELNCMKSSSSSNTGDTSKSSKNCTFESKTKLTTSRKQKKQSSNLLSSNSKKNNTALM